MHFKEYGYCRSVMKKNFNQNLVMTAEQNEEFERSNICWICGGLIDIDDNKVRDHCHIKSGNNYRGPAHWSCKKLKKEFLEKGIRGGVSYISKRYIKSSDDKTIIY